MLIPLLDTAFLGGGVGNKPYCSSQTEKKNQTQTQNPKPKQPTT